MIPSIAIRKHQLPIVAVTVIDSNISCHPSLCSSLIAIPEGPDIYPEKSTHKL